MKALRVWILLLLAVLLPMRGAMAAAMLCPPAGVGSQSEMRVMSQPAGHHGGMDSPAASHDHASHDHGSHHGALSEADAATPDAQSDGMADSATDKCNVCSAFCSVTSLVSRAPTLLVPLQLGSTVFPSLSAPVPTFLSDGQDRPPRSI